MEANSRASVKAEGTAKQSLTERLFTHLISQILTLEIRPGEHLPPERALAEQWSVNRQVVREATKRLAQLGLVKITQGDGTRVLDFMDTAGLDLLALMGELPHTAISGASVIRSVLEMRSAIATDLARLCAQRGSLTLKKQLVDAARGMATATSDEATFDLDVAFWDLVREGADNLAYRLVYNTLKKGALSIRAQILPWQLFEIRKAGYRMPLAKAIAKGDANRAERIAKRDFRETLAALVPMMTAAVESAPAGKPTLAVHRNHARR